MEDNDWINHAWEQNGAFVDVYTDPTTQMDARQSGTSLDNWNMDPLNGEGTRTEAESPPMEYFDPSAPHGYPVSAGEGRGYLNNAEMPFGTTECMSEDQYGHDYPSQVTMDPNTATVIASGNAAPIYKAPIWFDQQGLYQNTQELSVGMGPDNSGIQLNIPAVHPDSLMDLRSDIGGFLSNWESDFPEGRDSMINQFEDPWSSHNVRRNGHPFTSTGLSQTQFVGQMSASSFSSMNITVEYDASSVPDSNPATSVTTLENEIDEMMMSRASTIRDSVTNTYHTQHACPPTYNPMRMPPGPLPFQDAVRFQMRVREGTPQQTTDNNLGSEGASSFVLAERPGSLSVPPVESSVSGESSADSPSHMSVASSQISTTPSSVPPILVCNDANCGEQFHGNHRRGNLARHKRCKHRDLPPNLCAATGCSRIFKRSDARLKHYRKHHPWLALKPMVERPEQRRSRR